MRTRCEDHWHHLSPTAALLIIDAFQEGDMTGSLTHTVRCLQEAFTTERIQKFRRLYKGNNITFDGKVFNESKTTRNRLDRLQHR